MGDAHNLRNQVRDLDFCKALDRTFEKQLMCDQVRFKHRKVFLAGLIHPDDLIHHFKEVPLPSHISCFTQRLCTATDV